MQYTSTRAATPNYKRAFSGLALLKIYKSNKSKVRTYLTHITTQKLRKYTVSKKDIVIAINLKRHKNISVVSKLINHELHLYILKIT